MRRHALLVVPIAVALAGCGGSGKTAAPTTTAASTTAPATTRAAQPPPQPPPASALQAEATATAAGDIPDNQVFLTFRNPGAGYSMKYPEGWAQQGNGAQVTFRDKNNIVRVLIRSGTLPSVTAVHNELASVHLRAAPKSMKISGAGAVKVAYSTQSAPNAVTGKRVTLLVDRYYLSRAGKVAIVDLGTPVGVDNVDAYRMMIESFRWR
jgi:hypothetical protein